MPLTKLSYADLLPPRWQDKVLLAAMLIYELFKIGWMQLGDVGLGVIVLAGVYALIKNPHFFAKDAMVRIFIAVILWQLLAYFLMDSALQSTQEGGFKPNLSSLGNLFYFILLAYFLRSAPRSVVLVLFGLLLGIVTSALLKSPHFAQEWVASIRGYRVAFGIVNANHIATMSGAGLWVGGVLLWVLVQQWQHWRKVVMLPALALLLILLAMQLVFVYGSQSRATYLALVILSGFSVVFVVFFAIGSIKRRIVAGILLLAALGGLWAVAYNTPAVQARLQAERGVLKQWDAQGVGQLPNSSIGLRLKFWASALPYIKQHPWFGLGGESAREYVIKHSPILEAGVKKEYQHLHSGFITVLACYGIPALLMVLAVYGWLIYSAILLRQRVRMLAVFSALAFAIYFAIVNLTEDFFFFNSGQYIHNIILACIYSFYMGQKSAPLTAPQAR